MIDRKVERVHAAAAELDVVDVVLGGVALCVYELLFVRIDADDMADLLRQTERDRPSSTPDVQNVEIVA